MGNPQRYLFASAVIAVFALMAGGALADQIDGDWCFSDGRHVAINGAEIVTPAGALLTGVYERHSFHYVVPKDEPNAGSTVYMLQLNDDAINVMVGGNTANPAAAAIQEWHRCTQPAV